MFLKDSWSYYRSHLCAQNNAYTLRLFTYLTFLLPCKTMITGPSCSYLAFCTDVYSVSHIKYALFVYCYYKLASSFYNGRINSYLTDPQSLKIDTLSIYRPSLQCLALTNRTLSSIIKDQKRVD